MTTMFGALRTYSTSAVGYVRTKGNVVSVLAPQPKQQLELFAQLKSGERRSAFEKIKSSILFEQMNAKNRNLVFKSRMASSLRSRDEPTLYDMTLGAKSEEIELEPRKYLGPPSLQDFRVIVTTSHTPEDIEETLNYLQECMKSKTLRKNFDVALAGFMLKRAASAGVFQSTYHKLTCRLHEFKPLLKEPFYTEALRIYSLRIPYLSHRSKSMLKKLYSKADAGISSNLAFVYGLAQYKARFGDEHVRQLPEVVERIKKLLPPVLQHPGAAMKNMSAADLVLGYEGLSKCGVPGSEEVAESIAEVMQATSRNRPLTEALTVSLADVNQDGVEELEQEPEAKQEKAESTE